jgi:hypothetical protein
MSHFSDLEFCCWCQEAFGSINWLHVSEETVKVVLQSDLLAASESELLNALLDWGRAPFLLADGLEPDDAQLRAKIDPLLKLLRFGSMNLKEFCELSKTCNVLTAEEKLKIMRSILLNSEDDMPEEFSKKFNSRKKQFYLQLNSQEYSYGNYSNVFQFSLNKPVFLLGIHAPNFQQRETITVSWQDARGVHQASSRSGVEIELEGKKIIGLQAVNNQPFFIKENVVCSITFPRYERSTYTISSLSKQNQVIFTIYSGNGNGVNVNLSGLLFSVGNL